MHPIPHPNITSQNKSTKIHQLQNTITSCGSELNCKEDKKRSILLLNISKKQHPVNCEVTYKRSLQQLVSQLTDNLAWLCPPHGQMTKPWETENAAFSQKNCACNISNSQCFRRPNSHHFIRTKFVLSSPDYSTRRTWNGTNAIF